MKFVLVHLLLKICVPSFSPSSSWVFMCVYTYACLCVRVCVCACVCVHTCIFAYVYVSILGASASSSWMFMCVYICIFAYAYVSIFIGASASSSWIFWGWKGNFGTSFTGRCTPLVPYRQITRNLVKKKNCTGGCTPLVAQRQIKRNLIWFKRQIAQGCREMCNPQGWYWLIKLKHTSNSTSPNHGCILFR